MTLNIAHRGFSGIYPENTLLAFEKALEVGADGIEFDVHLSQDGKVVIIHDELVDRTTDAVGYVKDFTVKKLQKMNAGNLYDFGHQPIPTLEEYFQLLGNSDILTNIELKTGAFWYEGIEEKVLEIIDRFDRRDRVLISSFNHYSCLKFRSLAPEIPVGFLEESWIIDVQDYLDKHDIHYYHPYFYDVTLELANILTERKINIMAWTVNDESAMEKMINMGIRGIITNFPEKAAALLRKQQGNK